MANIRVNELRNSIRTIHLDRRWMVAAVAKLGLIAGFLLLVNPGTIDRM